MSNVLKKTLLVLGVIILISAVALPLISKVKATNEDLDLNSLIDDGDDNNTANNNTENTIPKTGVTEDITVIGFIVVCVGSAVYAYRKVRSYNV